MPDSRITKQIFVYDQQFTIANPNQSTWSSEIKQVIERNNLVLVSNSLGNKTLVSLLQESLMKKDICKFVQDFSKSSMLRTYNTLLSTFVDHSFLTKYVKFNLPFIVRKRLCQLKLGCLPLKF
jgi:hypothetical protein